MAAGHFPTVPIAIPIPNRLIFFAPHPDDIAISAGALAAWAASNRVPTAIVLVTDGSEAQLPPHLTAPHLATAEAKRRARGRMRVEEAAREAAALGLQPAAVRLLTRQTWFTEHRTAAEHLNDDLSLREVNAFVPAPADGEAAAEIRDAIGSGENVICAAPDANDRLEMHRITTALVSQNLGHARLLTYECLSTVEVTGPQTVLEFGEELMERKCAAIVEHRSMLERRKHFGGYSNPGREPYDTIVRRKNAALARELGLRAPYAERFGWTT